MRRGAFLLVLLMLGIWAGVAIADNGPPPGFQAAADKCKAQGLTAGSQDFMKCVATILGITLKPGTGTGPTGGTPPPGGGGQTPSTPAGKAAQACIQQGLKPNTPELSQCAARAVLSGAQQSAWDACIARNLTPQTDAFASCMDSVLHTNRGPALTDKQQDSVDYCLGKGLKSGTDEFKACLKTAGKAKLPAQAQAAVDACQAQGITDPNALGQCVSGLLKTKIPTPSNQSGPTPADVEAAFSACLDAGKKGGTANFQACVKKALGS